MDLCRIRDLPCVPGPCPPEQAYNQHTCQRCDALPFALDDMTDLLQQNALVSWSGGKDSCLALWRARQSGLAVRRLVTTLDEDGESSRSHGVPPQLIRAQAAALGLGMHFYRTSWANYEERFITALKQAKRDGIGHAVFGDIDLVAHREWEEKVCGMAGLAAELPLWNEPREKLVQEFLALGFKAIVVCVNGNYLTADFCGCEFDAAFIASLPAGVDACGENGEFHTFVYDGPGFAQPVAFQRLEVVSQSIPAELGRGAYHFQRLAAA